MSLMAVRIHDFWAKLWRPVRWNRGWLMGVGFVGFLRFFLMKNTKKQHEKNWNIKKEEVPSRLSQLGSTAFFFVRIQVFEMHSNLYMHAREISTFWCHFSVSHAEGRGSLLCFSICKSCSSMTCGYEPFSWKFRQIFDQVCTPSMSQPTPHPQNEAENSWGLWSQGDTSSNGGFPIVNIVMLGYRCVTVPT